MLAVAGRPRRRQELILRSALKLSKSCDMYIIHIRYAYGEGVLSDPLGLTIEDDSSKGEARWITVGANAAGEVSVVVWTVRDDGERLISVRRATAKERRDYEG